MEQHRDSESRRPAVQGRYFSTDCQGLLFHKLALPCIGTQHAPFHSMRHSQQTLDAFAISTRCPSKPKPVTSVHADVPKRRKISMAGPAGHNRCDFVITDEYD
jgi:hypothetical protein